MKSFLSEKAVVMNFSNMYEKQTFKDKEGFIYEDVSDITGTDCYCDDKAAAGIKARIEQFSYRGIHYIDSGNYHYMSKLWLDKADKEFVLVVFDNHPDMQHPAFGNILSCGGWIKEVLENNRFLQKVVVIGVNGELTDELYNTDEDVRREVDSGRAHFITRQQIAKETDCSADGCEDTYVNIYERDVKNFVGENKSVYISIDKDVLDESVVKTNWDQGDMRLNEMYSYIKYIMKENELLGVDVCGEPLYEDAVNEELIIKSNMVNEDIFNIIKKFLT